MTSTQLRSRKPGWTGSFCKKRRQSFEPVTTAWAVCAVTQAINLSLHYLERVIVALHSRSKGVQAALLESVDAVFVLLWEGTCTIP